MLGIGRLAARYAVTFTVPQADRLALTVQSGFGPG